MADIKDGKFVTSMFPLVVTEGVIGFDGIKLTETKKIINSHLKMLMLTAPGEIISDINFGVGLYNHLFLNENEPKILNLKSTIESQIRTYLPYLRIFKVTINRERLYQNKLAVRVQYSITNELTKDTLDFIVGEDETTTYFEDSGGSVTAATLSEILAERT